MVVEKILKKNDGTVVVNDGGKEGDDQKKLGDPLENLDGK